MVGNNKRFKSIVTYACVFSLVFGMIGIKADTLAAAKPKLSKKTIKVKVSKKVSLKIKNASKAKKVSWKIKNKKIAKITKKKNFQL